MLFNARFPLQMHNRLNYIILWPKKTKPDKWCNKRYTMTQFLRYKQMQFVWFQKMLDNNPTDQILMIHTVSANDTTTQGKILHGWMSEVRLLQTYGRLTTHLAGYETPAVFRYSTAHPFPLYITHTHTKPLFLRPTWLAELRL